MMLFSCNQPLMNTCDMVDDNNVKIKFIIFEVCIIIFRFIEHKNKNKNKKEIK